MEQIKVMNDLDNEYTGKTEVLFSKMVSIEHETPELFNGFVGTFDIYKKIRGLDNFLIPGRTAVPEIKFNYPDSSLYVIVVYHFASPLTDEQLNKLCEDTNKLLVKEVILCNLNNVEHIIPLGIDSNSYIKQVQLEAPDGFIYLDEIFKDQKDGPGYTEFLNNLLAFNRLKKLCKKLGYEVKDEMITGVMLPIHRKHSTTGSMLVHKDVVHQYEMYKISQNYIRGFEEGTNEHSIGVAMAHDIKFNEYVLSVAKRMDTEGKEPDADNFTAEFYRAIKRIKKNS